MSQEQQAAIAEIPSKDLLEAVRDRLLLLNQSNDVKRAVFQLEAAIGSRVIRGASE